LGSNIGIECTNKSYQTFACDKKTKLENKVEVCFVFIVVKMINRAELMKALLFSLIAFARYTFDTRVAPEWINAQAYGCRE
jgi:hypothetical protein